MNVNQRLILLMTALHQRMVHPRRVEVLVDALRRAMPGETKTILDVGCGDGRIGAMLCASDFEVEGVEVLPRIGCAIPCRPYDGTTLPFADNSFDLVMLVDVLHHCSDVQHMLSEVCRISRKYILIKDHVFTTRLEYRMLCFMDWVGNRGAGVPLPYGYQKQHGWFKLFAANDLKMITQVIGLPLYPVELPVINPNALQCIYVVEKRNEVSWVTN
jgi:SAM-dependent methyltransferase